MGAPPWGLLPPKVSAVVISSGAVTVTSGSITSVPQVSGTATLANKTGTGASLALAASNSARIGLHLFNDSGVTVYVNFGATASATAFTVKMPDQSFFAMRAPVFTGAVNGLWASGDVRVTELT